MLLMEKALKDTQLSILKKIRIYLIIAILLNLVMLYLDIGTAIIFVTIYELILLACIQKTIKLKT